MPRRRLLDSAKTMVYWDTYSWHPPKKSMFFEKPGYIGLAIRLPLYEEGVRSLESIEAFCDYDMFTEEQMIDCEYLGINTLIGGKKWPQVNMMIMDIAVRALDDRFRIKKPNMVVFTKISEHTEMMTRALISLRRVGCNVLFALPDDTTASHDVFGVSLSKDENGNVSLALLSDLASKVPVVSCPDLFDEDKVLRNVEDDDDDDDDDEDEDEDEDEDGDGDGDGDVMEVEEAESLEPFMPVAESSCFVPPNNVHTYVFWDVQDYPVPLGLQPDTFIQNIKTALGIKDDLLIMAYVVDEKSFPHSYHAHSRITSVSADKFARINVLMLDLICWATKNCSRDFASCPNLLIISESSEEDTNFWPLIQGLSCRGYNTFVAAPETGLRCRGIYAHRLALPWKILSSKGKRKDREDTVSDSDY